jgi:outer membrane protein assembly factor BamB
MNIFHFPVLLMVIALMMPGNKQNTTSMIDTETLYPFEGKYIDLEVLILVQPVAKYSSNFKTLSKYAFRFNAPDDWLNNFSKEATFKGASFKIEKDGSLVYKTATAESYQKIDALPKGAVLDNVVGNEMLLTVKDGVIRLSRLQEGNTYQLKKYDASGTALFEANIQHTDVVVEGNTNYSHPYLYYFGCTPDYLIFTSNNRDYPKTVTVELQQGKVTTYDFSIAGIIRDEDESNVPGFITINRDESKFTTLLLNLSWKGSLPGNGYNKAEILMKGEVLYVSFYHGIATGSSLYAFNLGTGEKLWQADVKQLNVSHSEYYNTVRLSSWKDYIILEGIEAEGHYVQIFKADSGERVFSTF